MKYHARMNDIEVAAFRLNNVQLVDGTVLSAPRVDWYWGLPGGVNETDWRDNQPYRWRTQKDIRIKLRRAPWMPHVMLPHVVAVVLGIALFVAAVAGAPGLQTLKP